MARATDRFRHEVHEALDLWVAEDLIGPEHAAAIREYYGVAALAPVARARGLAIVRLVAGLALGVGLLSLAAANWDGLADDARLGLTVVAWLGLNVVGCMRWQRGGTDDAGLPFLLAGTFAMGAVAGTLAQIFQLGGEGWELWAGWGTGALLMAGAVRSAPLGFVAAFALAGAAAALPPPYLWAVPAAFALGLVPLAYRVDSRALLVVGLLGASASFLWFGLQAGAELAAAFTLAVAAWSWQGWHARRLPYHTLREALVRRDAGRYLHELTELEWVRALAISVLFTGWWLASGMVEAGPIDDQLAASPLLVVVVLAGAAAAAGAAWASELAHTRHRALHVAVGVVGLAGAALSMPGVAAELLGPASIGAHVLLATTVMRAGLDSGDRGLVWFGGFDLAAAFVAIWLLAEEAMVVRGMAFALAGVLLAGLAWWWERTKPRDGDPGAVPA